MPHDAILIAGGGLLPDGALLPWVVERFDRALAMRTGEPLVCLSAGTPHKPSPRDARGFPISEAAAGARYLLSRGVRAEDIVLESLSLDTIGNAFFARLLHAGPRGWRKLLFITSAFHRPRLEAVCRHVFALPPGPDYELAFESTPDDRMPAADVAFRREREAASLAKYRELARGITTAAEMHRFVFERHSAYSAAGLAEPRTAPDALARVY